MLNEFSSEVLGPMCVGFVLFFYAIIVWKVWKDRKMPKHKGKNKRARVNQADIAMKDAMSQVSGTPMSNGSISPIYFANQHNRDRF